MLKVNNIETLYGYILALNGISIQVEEGKIVAILGANGAGKTTLLKTITGLLEDQPDKGTITFLEQRIDGMDPEDIVHLGISMVPEGREVFPELSVMENLWMGSFIRKDKKGIAQDLERIYMIFPILKERIRQEAGTLSGGEQQMLAIGRALMSCPKLLLMDEPSLGLAPLIVEQIFKVIKGINQEETTILLVEQNARKALDIAHFGYVLETGRIVLFDVARELLNNEDVQEFYLGIQKEESAKGYQRYKRKKRWR